MPQFAHLDGTFVNAKITANNDGYDRNVVKLTVDPGEGEDGKLMRETDGTYKDMYYLQPDEYIQFGIMGYVTDDASAHKGAFTNDVIMEYVDFNGAGVEMVTKEEEPVIVSNKNGLMPNDGDRRIIDDEVVNSIGNYMPNYTGNHKKKPDDLWLSSSVDVVRGSVVPGINKTVSGEIFLTGNGKSLSRRQIWAEMKRLCVHAGVEPSKVFPHNLRHCFATAYYRAYRDIAKLADVLGHSSIETTRIYLLTSGEEHQRQLDRLGLVS